MKRYLLKKQVLVIIFNLLTITLFPQQFVEQTDIILPGVSNGSVAWGDYDNDDDLDILIAGFGSDNYLTVKVFRNYGSNSFTDQVNIFSPAIPPAYAISNTRALWVDFDNDGFIDILINSPSGTGGNILLVYRNEGNNTFTQKVNIEYLTLGENSVDCGDYDNDGDQDILLTTHVLTKIFQNQGNFIFNEQYSVSLPGGSNSSSRLGDYDNDGDLDLILTGQNGSKVFQNQGNNVFTDISFNGVSGRSSEWGDFNNDGFLDILITGSGNSMLYKNNGNNTFTSQSDITLPGVSYGTGEWGDMDNDGDLDIIITGNDYTSDISKVYYNNGDNTFAEATGINLDGVSESSVDLDDYDNDGDLDILLSGKNGPSKICKVYKNDSPVNNPLPVKPTGLTSVSAGNDIILKWNPVTSDNTPAKSLSYNVMIGTISGGTDVVSPNSSGSGFRKISAIGNSQLDTTFVLRNIKNGTYYWKVQAIDNSYKGGEFSSESTFTYSSSYQATRLNGLNTGGKETTLKWSRGNGDNCIVFVKAGDDGTAYPDNNTSYTASDVFGSGSQIGSTGWYCVYKGNQNSVHVTGLSPQTEYVVQVQEFYGSMGSETYNNLISEQNTLVFRTGYFTELINVHLASVNSSSMNFVQSTDRCWLDFDNDDDLDLFITGNNGTHLYQNGGNDIFSEVSMTSDDGNTAACGDYNNDGYIDIAITNTSSTRIFVNNGNSTFTQLSGTSISGASYGSIDWGDYDNDGDLDLILTGEASSSGSITKIYRNNGNDTFTEMSNHNLPAVRYGSTDWGDYDNDGYLDLILSGINLEGSYITRIFRNDINGGFIEQNDLSSAFGIVKWGDYDNDGDLDVLFISSSGNKVFRNEGNNSFSMQDQISLGSSLYGNGGWGDYDNDGFLDILISGYMGSYIPFTKVYKNNRDNTFREDTNCILTPAGFSSSAWGDYDNDGDLDILLMGVSLDSAFTKIYRNDIESDNQVPDAPSGLSSTVNKSSVELKWNSIRSDSTNYLGMTYNLMVGTTSGGFDVVNPHASSTGYRRLVEMGNGNLDTTFYLKNLPFGTYYWSVQAVDNGFAGGPFSVVDNFSIVPVQATNLTAKILSNSSLLLKWERGNGSRCIIFCKETSTDISIPVDNKSYIPDNEYGYGEQIGTTGWYCVFNSRSDSVIITGLKYKTDYSFQVIEYLGEPGSEQYFTELTDGNPGIFSTGLFSEQTSISLNNAWLNNYTWGDYNNDGFSDILIPGFPTVLYQNNGDNSFSEVSSASLPNVRYGEAAWGDYDDDGDLDILITGATGDYPDFLPAFSKIYRNDGSGLFTEQTQISLEAVYFSSADWGDYDNDGDLDIILTGATGNDPNYDPISKIYRNNGDGSFTAQEQIGLPGVSRGDVKWVDYDNDGDLDLHLSGGLDYQYNDNCISRIYKNEGNSTFTEQTLIVFPGLWEASVDWGDYDNDGDLDVVMTRPGLLYAYQNQGDSFTRILYESYGYSSFGSVCWGDYNNDGFIDILFTSFGAAAKIFRNNKGDSFSLLDDDSFKFTMVEGLEWCDYDNDSDIDILVYQWGTNCKLYKNNLYMQSGLFKSNNPADAPDGLIAKYSPGGITLNWNPVKSDETKYPTLSYNVKIGTTRDRADICPPHSDSTGFRKITSLGNAQLDTTYLAKNFVSGKYYWGVQAVDQGFKGGAWSVIDSFEVKNVQTFFSSDTVCLGLLTHFIDQSVANDGITSWKWDFKDGTTSSDQNPVHTYSTSGTYNVKLVITDNGGVKDSLEKNVIVKARPITSFTAPNVCEGATTAITNNTNVNGLIISSWYWNFGDGNTSAVQNPGTHTYSLKGTYLTKLKAVATNGCADSISKEVIVAATPNAAVSVNGKTTFCQGDSVQLNVEHNPLYSYQWKLDNNDLVNSDTSLYTVKTNSGAYSVQVTNTLASCIATSGLTNVTVNPIPVSPYISASGPIQFCQGDSVTLSVSNTTGYTYQWKLNGGAVGSASNQFVAKNAGTYNLVVSNTNGCSALSSNSVIVAVNSLPSASLVSLSGTTQFCEGGNVTLSIPLTADYSYAWRNESGLISNAKTNSYQAITSGKYQLDISNVSGCVVKTTAVEVLVKPSPGKPVIDPGNYQKGKCPGETPIRLNVSNVAAVNDYQWYQNGVQIPNANSTFLEDFLRQGIYKVEAILGDCTVQSDTLNVIFDDALAKPYLYAQGPTVWYLACSNDSAFKYKWYYNGTLIQGADKYLYVANQKLGKYNVSVSNTKGCFTMSDTLTIPTGATGIEDIDPFEDLIIYPNPTSGLFTLEMDNQLFGELMISILEQGGKKILNFKFEKTTEHFSDQIDLSRQAKGVYIISLHINGQISNKKIIIE